MIVKEFDYNGSSALKPQRKEQTIPSKENYDKKKKKIEQQRRKKQKDKKIKKSVYQIVLLILVVGGITISRDVKVYKTQQQLDSLNKEINSVITENEALKVQILKASSLDKIEETAKNKLKMILPTKENMIKLGESQAAEGKQ
ncbi:septum formation initiator family protein [Clostridium perfringens]|uniref:Cell division protein FtsL n=1 Tax=Clostridium perfringens TaxID=1502 RepID=A0A2X2YBC1_CLOPF|nr:septum formation initiator family protein [Clostridium perfringens]EDS80408.1 putative cell division protein FtsL [Clostridium perfringens C str. JGS1495]ELC8421644.1 septum formation initiator family protein [Clostridium perfringens]ELC8451363.1 septum formation initiator family protein [Clostridium perfringens]MDV5112330.1 septum formation initiator family protein [Clostridium perfringens]NGT45610.1 cell division protein FtsL [Clostridium perfringens]